MAQKYYTDATQNQNPADTWSRMIMQSQALDQPDGDAEDLAALSSMVSEPGLPPPMSSVPPQPWMGKGGKRNQSVSVTTKTRTPSDPGQAAERQQMLDLVKQYGQASQDALAQQQQGVDELGNKIQTIQDKPMTLSDVNFKPLAGFYGLNPDSMPTPETPQAREQRLLGLSMELQKARQGLSKEKTDALKDQIAAYKAAKDTTLDDQVKQAKIGFYSGGIQDARQQSRIDEMNHTRVVNNLKNDKQLLTQLTPYNNLEKGLDLATTADKTPPQQLEELQQVIRGSSGLQGKSGVGERADTYIKTLGMKRADAMQFLTGNIQDVKDKQFLIDHLSQLAEIERSLIRKQMDKRISTVSGGFDTMYQRRPDLKGDRDALVKGVLEQFSPDSSQETGAGAQAPAPAVGTIQPGKDGNYKFKGGDRTKKENWEKVN